MSVQPALYDELAGVTPILTNPFKLRSDFVYSQQLASHRRSILSVLIAAWMIDTHDLLSSAWKALHSPVALKLPGSKEQALLAQLVTPPCTEAELQQLVDTDWKNPVKRTALVNQ